MAAITLDSVNVDPPYFTDHITGLFAGEALAYGHACYIKAADGLVYKSTAAGDNEAAKIHGFTGRLVAIGQPVTLLGVGTRFHYAASGLTPGAQLFLSAVTAGELATAAGVGDSVGCAFAIDATDIMVTNLHLKFS
jgi:hypothetical protein